MASHTPDDDAGSPSAKRLGVAGSFDTAVQALNRTVMQRAVERPRLPHRRTVRLTRDGREFTKRLPSVGNKLPRLR